MSQKPVIGMNADFRPERKNSIPFSWINAGQYDSITASGGVPFVIPPLAEDDDLKRLLENVDGLVLGGCKLDLEPVRLGFDPNPATRPMPSRREDFDRRLARLAFDMKIPTLAIGAGMQTLNIICGGTLFQHIPSDVLKSLQHRDPVESCLRHVIEIVPGTKMDQIYGPGEIRVNSDHHMAVDNVASCFRVSATAMDGVVEAYESVLENWWCLGVQFHPENQSSSALDMQVFQAFIDGVKEQHAPAILSFEDRQAA
ncbi:MAG: gamma-glutamyl-gamma-aminobutyrate hydrolase family protein [Planctomycetota bacterium]|nr:MAG: gamma-glutamyl-gamma-aminobutyrate hydrolase family protein [Planctomycetota bacterium]REJ89333.1 MAG: gamma-glutamyl-gamma-aminobutyrate hydrolase family protein [Planctomycetota bacterium]REK30344.1 MAG: gamma-glutamyl-gamma-aminobutyrate hydrolase family protein [Planctomycetota bacterium]REK31550.1 MAG: gamma-glutamyl-gamma-aminobutyrate hydrolase family protein [Planctomycetota bacterium]